MKHNKYSSITLVKIKPGVYTTMVTYDGTNVKAVRPWLLKHGRKAMEKQLGYEVIDYNKKYPEMKQ